MLIPSYGNYEDVDDFTEEQAKTLLKDLLEKLDDMDGDDAISPEGWRNYFGYEG